MMAEDEVLVPGTKLNIVKKCRDRVHRLFKVSSEMTFIAIRDGGPCRLTLHTAESSPQDSINKAKKYLEAVLGDRPEICCNVIKTTQQGFETLLMHRDVIEMSTQTFLQFEPPCALRIQGYPECIDIAKHYISNILSSNRQESLYKANKASCSLTGSYESRDGLHQEPYKDTDILSSASQEPFNSDGFDIGLLPRGAGPDLPHPPAVVLPSDTLSNHGSSASSSTRSLSPSSDNPTNNPEYRIRLEKAVKLGYTEEQLIYTLKKLGFDADQNQVLSEMIKLGFSAKVNQDKAIGVEDTADKFDDRLIEKRKDDVIEDSSNLRHIVVDGSNVAMNHGKNVFSCQGIKLAVEWFQDRGHEHITVFVPVWRKEASRPDAPIRGQEILLQLEKEGVVSFTPARRIGGHRMVCYDDRFILKFAVEVNGIVVSNDNFRDLVNEKPEFKKVVEERLLMYTFASNRFMPPDDPLGRHGPTLDNFLRKEPTVPETLPPECPYGKKCTYGNKCRYYHPERGSKPQQLITDRLREQAKKKMQEKASCQVNAQGGEKISRESVKKSVKNPLSRTQSVFPEGLADEMVAPPKITSTGGPERQDYNEKLNIARMKYERAELTLSYAPEASDSLHVGRQGDSFDYMASARDNQLQVPPSQPSEGYVSGHLLLAKKLSDEAQDSTAFFQSAEPCQASPQPLTKSSSQHKTVGLTDFFPRQYGDQMSIQSSHLERHTRRECHSGPGMYMRQDPSGASLEYVEHCHSFPLQHSEYVPQQPLINQRPPPYSSDLEMYGYQARCHQFPSSGMPYLQNAVGYSTSDSMLHMGSGRRAGRARLTQIEGDSQRFPGSTSFGLAQSNGGCSCKGQSYHGRGEGSTRVLQSGMLSLQNADVMDQFSPAGQERCRDLDYQGRLTQSQQPHHLPNLFSSQPNLMLNVQYPTMQNTHTPLTMDTQIPVTDPRYPTFYHLCGLFPPAKVAVVMNQHPHENDPKMLYHYIISLEERI